MIDKSLNIDSIVDLVTSLYHGFFWGPLTGSCRWAAAVVPSVNRILAAKVIMKPSEATGPWDVGTTATSSVDITSHISIASVFDIQIHHNSSTLHTKDAITDIKISGFKPQQPSPGAAALHWERMRIESTNFGEMKRQVPVKSQDDSRWCWSNLICCQLSPQFSYRCCLKIAIKKCSVEDKTHMAASKSIHIPAYVEVPTMTKSWFLCASYLILFVRHTQLVSGIFNWPLTHWYVNRHKSILGLGKHAMICIWFAYL